MSTAENSEVASNLVRCIIFDILIIDVMMPGINGLTLTKKLMNKIQSPIILLTAKNEVTDRILGLEAGADDYLSKPFEPRELVLRIENILKRAGSPKAVMSGSKSYHIGDLRYNFLGNALWKGDDECISLTSAERILMEELLHSSNIPVSRSFLAKKLFHTLTNKKSCEDKTKFTLSDLSRERTVDVNVNRLRKKIEKYPKSPRYLKTVRGVGYILIAEKTNNESK